MTAVTTPDTSRAGRLYVHATGPQGATPIVFLHPSGSNATAWDQHLDILGEAHRCLAVDLPGHRHSQGVAWESLDSTADHIADLITEQAGGRAHVVGLSLGGSAASTLMSRRPEVLDDVIVDGADALPNPWAWLLKGDVSAISPALHTRLVIRSMATALGVDADEFASFAAGLQAIPPTVFRRAFCQAQDVRISDNMLQITAPVLLVAGERDPRATRTSNATLAPLLPDAEARFLPGVGHAWMATHPQLHAQMVRAWIAGEPLPKELQPETHAPGRSTSAPGPFPDGSEPQTPLTWWR